MKKKIGHLGKKGSFNFKIDFKSSKKNEKCVTAFKKTSQITTCFFSLGSACLYFQSVLSL